MAVHSLLTPPKFRLFYSEYHSLKFCILDIGCGNHSPRLTKKWFPNSIYHGVDRYAYNNDKEDYEVMDQYFEIDLATGSLDCLENDFYDVIILNHVIEHLANSLSLIEKLCQKLKLGGKIYIEYPGVRSLTLPSMKGCLNFCDDSTHIRVYSVQEVANTLLSNSCKILEAGTRRIWLRIILFPVLYIKYALKGAPGSALWDLLGFAEYVYAVRL
ncbi:MAG: class I SAM-dependent methyltransferase [Calothrix sp. MO_167.B12]|nr:class I SAM-dependent methyltransferase [Calothrix sp. MO_167.B12]